MAEDRAQHVALDWLQDFEFAVTFEDAPGAPTLVVDEAAPLGGGRGPNPAAMLAASVGSCLASSLVFCLSKSRVHPSGLRVRAVAHVERNDAGRFRITGIDVQIAPGVSDADANRLMRCEDLYEDFCIVTESVRHGIPVNVTVAEPHDVTR